jgi:CDP-paratose 2-epimerase
MYVHILEWTREDAEMKSQTILVTGSSGLIGSEAVRYFDGHGHNVVGVDNNMRRTFFGAEGDTTWNLKRLREATRKFEAYDIDIRDRERIVDLFKKYRFDLILHCAAQPSHDKAAEIPLIDFEVNALGTMCLLESMRQHCRDGTFVFMSTNKVYGDRPNRLPLRELSTRFDYADVKDYEGIDETCGIDQTLHSLFGASKVAADILAQEYGRYFGMNVGIFRGGCLTGAGHAGVEQHGFLSYLVKVAVSGRPYTIYGYEGKQVRDNIHSEDVIRAVEEFAKAPRLGEVYNLGGGRENSVSIIEAIKMIEEMTDRKVAYRYEARARAGDHICYISNLCKLRSHYSGWSITRDLTSILREMIEAEVERQRSRSAIG